MSVKSKRVNLSIPPNRIRYILDVGRQNNLQNTDASLSLASICTKIVLRFIGFYTDEVEAYLRKEGGTLLGLIPRALKFYIDENGQKKEDVKGGHSK